MATDKKSFLLYCDIIHTVNKLSNEQAGELFKHILSYVNDENPTTDNIIIELAFEPIKQSLKRDLKKYESILKKRSEAGKRSAEIRQQKQHMLTHVGTCQQSSTNSTVSDSVSDSDSDSVSDSEINNNIFNFKKELIKLGIEEKIVSDWLKVRKKKKATNTETAFNLVKSQIEKTKLSANECIKMAVGKSWAGFNADWIKKESSEKEKKGNVNSAWSEYMKK